MNRLTATLGLIGLALAPPFVSAIGDPTTAAIGLLALLVLGMVTAWNVRSEMRRQRRARMTRPCGACWYELDGLPPGRCPECGEQYL
ncbi:MAG: hypothetical protein ACKVZJ_11215 [Phycisphaerales bacterium]